MMQGQKDLEAVSKLIMSELTPLVSAHHGAFYIMEDENNVPVLKLIASYAYKERKHVGNRFHLGEGLVGQAALEKKPILLTSVPDDYIRITSGLGEAPPRNILVLPVLFEGEVKAVIELASFLPFSQIHQLFLDQLAESVGVVLNMISRQHADERAARAVAAADAGAAESVAGATAAAGRAQEVELRARSADEIAAQLRGAAADQQVELQQVNEELEEKASLLAEQNRKVEQKNEEVEAAQARTRREGGAARAQLEVQVGVPREHVARAEDSAQQPAHPGASCSATTRTAISRRSRSSSRRRSSLSGSDLLILINDVLDLSKVEAGKMDVNPTDVRIADVKDFVERSFDALAEQKGLSFNVEITSDLPQSIYTDGGRLQQVLKNLLSNAFKFTQEGNVTLTVRRAEKARRFQQPGSRHRRSEVIAFAVTDTGIGIPKDKQRLIFEAFQQADGTTSRKFGGTGLGLSISREIARLLGGEIRVESSRESGEHLHALPAGALRTASGRPAASCGGHD